MRARPQVALMASHLLAEKRLPPISDRMKQLRDLLVGNTVLDRPWDKAAAGAGDATGMQARAHPLPPSAWPP